MYQERFLPYRVAEFTWVSLTPEDADSKAVPEGPPAGKAGEAAEPRGSLHPADPPYPRVGKPGGAPRGGRWRRGQPVPHRHTGCPSPLPARLQPGPSCRPAAILRSRGSPSGGPASSRPGEAALPREATAQVTRDGGCSRPAARPPTRGRPRAGS